MHLLTKGSMKKDLMKKLLKELQDNKREKEDKLNQVIIQTKSCAESMQNTTQENKSNSQRDIHWVFYHHGRNQECRTSWRKREETPFEESSSDKKYDAIKSDDVSINNFIAALKVTSTVKSALRINLAA